jgi:membrane-associated HD superfamily phosphohydrolase
MDTHSPPPGLKVNTGQIPPDTPPRSAYPTVTHDPEKVEKMDEAKRRILSQLETKKQRHSSPIQTERPLPPLTTPRETIAAESSTVCNTPPSPTTQLEEHAKEQEEMRQQLKLAQDKLDEAIAARNKEKAELIKQIDLQREVINRTRKLWEHTTKVAEESQAGTSAGAAGPDPLVKTRVLNQHRRWDCPQQNVRTRWDGLLNRHRNPRRRQELEKHLRTREAPTLLYKLHQGRER